MEVQTFEKSFNLHNCLGYRRIEDSFVWRVNDSINSRWICWVLGRGRWDRQGIEIAKVTEACCFICIQFCRQNTIFKLLRAIFAQTSKSNLPSTIRWKVWETACPTIQLLIEHFHSPCKSSNKKCIKTLQPKMCLCQTQSTKVLAQLWDRHISRKFHCHSISQEF